LRLLCVCAVVDLWVVVVVEEGKIEEGKAEKVEVMGERVGVAVAKKGVVGEGFVDEVVDAALVIEVWEEWEVVPEVPEEMICWFVAHMKMGRPIVSFASVSICSSFLRWSSAGRRV
jgi:hypothetical protein